MKIVREEPQQLLVLESPRASLPTGAVGLVLALVVGAVVVFTVVPLLVLVAQARIGADGVLYGLPLLLLSFIGPFILYLRLRGQFTVTVKVRVDRYAGELEIEDENLIFAARPKIARLADVSRLVVGNALVRPHWLEFLRASRSPMAPGVRLFVEWQDGGRKRSHTVTFPVEDLDKREEVADLAYRMGRAAGLFYSRVLRSDQRDLEVEITRDRVTGSEPLPQFEAPAEYAKDVVAPQALRAASEEKVPAFVPAEFKSPSRVQVWEPRREVRFHKPAGLIALGCMPFTLLVLVGPALLLIPPSDPARPAGRFIISGVLGVMGLFFGWLASQLVSAEAGRDVKLDWAGNRVRIRGAFLGETYALSDIRELELRSVRRYVRTGKTASYHYYTCDVLAHLRPGAAPKAEPLLLVATDSFREDPDTPYRMALPLATELAEALNVPHRVTAST